jgi:hypothetical protein
MQSLVKLVQMISVSVSVTVVISVPMVDHVQVNCIEPMMIIVKFVCLFCAKIVCPQNFRCSGGSSLLACPLHSSTNGLNGTDACDCDESYYLSNLTTVGYACSCQHPLHFGFLSFLYLLIVYLCHFTT